MLIVEISTVFKRSSHLIQVHYTYVCSQMRHNFAANMDHNKKIVANMAHINTFVPNMAHLKTFVPNMVILWANLFYLL